MPLPRDYATQPCPLARALELVGERWTLLILRDLFMGVHRFTDLLGHLDIPRAVLSARLGSLVEHGLVERRPSGRYHLTAAGSELWPVVGRAGIPVLLVTATEPPDSREQNDEGARRLLAAIPSADWRSLEGAGHDLIADRGPELGALVADWLAPHA